MKKSFTTLLLSLALVLMFVLSGYAQTPTGRIVVKGIPDRYKSANKNESTSGLKNVGIGCRTIFEAMAVTGTGSSVKVDSFISASWTITGPTGSVATIQDTAAGLSGRLVYFVPDSTGFYEIQATVVSKSGTTLPTIKIHAAKWVGAGISVANGSIPASCVCHSFTEDKFTEWQKTKHATVVSRRLDENGGHFGNNCLSCHSVGFNKATSAVNNGFDDVATAIGFNVPTNHPGVYDSLVTAQPKLMSLTGIQCENCHGPAGEHMKRGDDEKMDATLSSDVCAPCHFSSDRHGKGYSWAASRHATSMVEGANFEYMNRSGCSQCHTGQGFIEQTIEGGTAGTYTNVQPITCAVCHDPHSDENPMQLRRKSVAQACDGCHTVRLSSRGFHHSHQAPMLAGTDGWELAGYEYPNSGHTAIEDRCVDCHMANSPTYDPTYAKPDTLLNKLGGHTFKVAYDNGTPDNEEDDIINSTGCVECHQITGEFDVKESQEKIKELLATLKALLPIKASTGLPYAHTDTAYKAWTPAKKAGAYNYFFVDYEGSYGVHNHKYAEALLKASIEQLRLGAGASSIASVKDVPNDQGKQVQIVWGQFPAEKYSINPITSYGIWRRDAAVTGKTELQTVNSFTEMLQKASVGSKYVFGSDVWTYVGFVPTANLSQYSYNAPTLFDSTKVSGMIYTYFYVSGHTAINDIVYSTVVDSGYSVDNLSPNVPSGLTAQIVNNFVRLEWNTSEDTDLRYYAIYRSTSEKFNPSSENLLTTVTAATYNDESVAQGNKYYYRISAYDFSGNESRYSPEIGVTVMDVVDNQSLPKEYALSQNHPNPFNPSTEIRYQLPEASHVKIVVYNTLGKVIATLVDETLDAGYHNAVWNGKDYSGNDVASGIYLYKMEAGSYSSVKKMILIK